MVCLPFFHSLAATRKHTSVWSPSAPLAWPPSTGGSRNKDGQHIMTWGVREQYSWRQSAIKNFLLLSLLLLPAINSRWEWRFGKRKVWFAVHVRIKNNKVEGCNVNIMKGETSNFPSWLSCWGFGKQGLRGFFQQETMVFVLVWIEHDALLGP